MVFSSLNFPFYVFYILFLVCFCIQLSLLFPFLFHAPSFLFFSCSISSTLMNCKCSYKSVSWRMFLSPEKYSLPFYGLNFTNIPTLAFFMSKSSARCICFYLLFSLSSDFSQLAVSREISSFSAKIMLK